MEAQAANRPRLTVVVRGGTQLVVSAAPTVIARFVDRRDSSRLSCDIAYLDSPAASRVSVWPRYVRTQRHLVVAEVDDHPTGDSIERRLGGYASQDERRRQPVAEVIGLGYHDVQVRRHVIGVLNERAHSIVPSIDDRPTAHELLECRVPLDLGAEVQSASSSRRLHASSPARAVSTFSCDTAYS